MKPFLSLVTFFIFSFSLACGAIYEADHFEDLLKYVDQDTLIILDIDDTLLIPKQMLGCDEWFTYRWKKHAEVLNKEEALEKALAEWQAVRHLTQMEIVEPNTENIVHHLQEQGYTVMGLTTQGLALATRTVLQLKASDIDLSLTAPSQKDFYFTNGHGILFRHGILFTSGTHKGHALFTLCKHLNLHPKKIVFINDKASHIKEIEKDAIEHNIEFIGLRYSYSDAKKAAFRVEIAEFQFSHSTLNHLLSDEEAIELYNSQELQENLKY